MEINKKIALIAAGSLLSVGGLYAVSTSANAATPAAPTAPAITSPVSDAQDAPDTDNIQAGNVNDANEADETGSDVDGQDTGLDMNALEAGHQDAPGADDATEGTEVAGK